MNKNMAILFNLQGLLVDSVTPEEKRVVISVRSPRRQAACYLCGQTSRRVHQRRARMIRHTTLDDRTVWLKATYRRFLCRSCGKPFTETLPGIDRQRTTRHGRQRTVRHLSSASINAAAEELSLSTATITRQLLEAYQHHRIDWTAQGESFSLGVDEHSFSGHDMALTVTNLTTRELLAILPDDRQETLRRWLREIPQESKERIKEVCIDMRTGFRTVIEEVLPDAAIVADHYHVIAHANGAVNEIRSVLLSHRGWQPKIRRLLMRNRETLSTEDHAKLMQVFEYYRSFPSLEIAWQAKEKLRDMYRCQTKEEAEKQFRLILLFLTEVESKYLKDLRGTLARWRPYILNFFDQRTTNAFTEGCHTKIKLMKRVSFGFRNRYNYIAKMTLAFVPFFLSYPPHLLT